MDNWLCQSLSARDAFETMLAKGSHSPVPFPGVPRIRRRRVSLSTPCLAVKTAGRRRAREVQYFTSMVQKILSVE